MNGRNGTISNRLTTPKIYNTGIHGLYIYEGIGMHGLYVTAFLLAYN